MGKISKWWNSIGNGHNGAEIVYDDDEVSTDPSYKELEEALLAATATIDDLQSFRDGVSDDWEAIKMYYRDTIETREQEKSKATFCKIRLDKTLLELDKVKADLETCEASKKQLEKALDASWRRNGKKGAELVVAKDALKSSKDDVRTLCSLLDKCARVSKLKNTNKWTRSLNDAYWRFGEDT